MIPLLLGNEATLWMPPQSSTVAGQIDWLYYAIYWICVVVFIGVVGAMLWLMWRYRRKPGEEADQTITHHLPLEVTWSVIPLFVVILFFYYGFVGFMDLRTPPPEAYKVQVDASQWAWKFIYPNGAQSEVLHVPPNEPVVLIMESQDVLHAFFVPDFRVKQDIVPGRYTELWFEATQPGTTAPIYCTEYCGTEHSEMTSSVVVEEDRAAFDAWVKEKARIHTPDRTPAEAGEILYGLNCKSCHNLSGKVNVGPNFNVLSERWGETRPVELRGGGRAEVEVGPEYVTESINDPGAKLAIEGAKTYENAMNPTLGDTLSDEDKDALIAFIKSLESESSE